MSKTSTRLGIDISPPEKEVRVDILKHVNDFSFGEQSPLDQLFAKSSLVIRIANGPIGPGDQEKECVYSGLLLTVFSATEEYFRRIIGVLPKICPLAAERCAEQAIPIGSLDYYTGESIHLALLEAHSFCEAGQLKSQLGRLSQA